MSAALVAAAAVVASSGCSGSRFFPTQAVMPATLDQTYDEVKDKDPAADVSESSAAFLAGFDADAARPTKPTPPTEPRPSTLASERFTLADLAMPTRPADATACTLIAAQVGGGQARCAEKGDAALSDSLPAGVPAGSYVVGKAYGDGRMVLLDQPGDGGEMWDAAMHERGHLLATWLCGRADCLNAKFVSRGYRDSPAYLGSITEGFAQSWAQCNGAKQRSDYVILKCPDVTAVVAEAQREKAAAKKDYEEAKKAYDSSVSDYQARLRDYDKKNQEIDAVQRFASARASKSTT